MNKYGISVARRLADFEHIGADSRNNKNNNTIRADDNARVVIMLVRHPSHPSLCDVSLPDIRVWPTRLQCTRCEQVTYAGSCYRPYRAAGASACSPCAAGSYYGSTGARHLMLTHKYRLYHVTLTSRSSARCAYIFIFHISRFPQHFIYIYNNAPCHDLDSLEPETHF